MKILYCLLFFLGTITLSFSQEMRVPKKKFLDFSEEPKKTQKYKILELRYIVMTNHEQFDSLIVEKKEYKLFQNRNQAIEYYYAIQHIAQKKEVYYITVMEPKSTEYFPFKENK